METAPTNIGHRRSDVTLLGHGGSAFASNSFPGAIPVERVRDLFDFKVEYADAFMAVGDDFVPIPGRQVVRHSDNNRVFNVVSKRHGLHQFSDILLPAVSDLVDINEADLQVVGAGLLEFGAVGWIQVQAPTTIIGGDEIAPTITVVSSHNGRFASSFRTGIKRFACSNEIGVLRSGGEGVYKVRHTSKSSVRIGQARDVLGIMWNQVDTFTDDVQRLIDTTVTDSQFDQIVAQLNPRPVGADGHDAAPAAITRWEKRTGEIQNMYHNDPRCGFTGTAWGAVQAFSTWGQHLPVKTMSGGETSRHGRTMHDFIAGKIETTDIATAETVRKVVGVA